jgi:hypothetical protein
VQGDLDHRVGIERSRSGDGAHVWVFFSEPVAAARARKLASALLTDAMGRRPAICNARRASRAAAASRVNNRWALHLAARRARADFAPERSLTSGRPHLDTRRKLSRRAILRCAEELR